MMIFVGGGCYCEELGVYDGQSLNLISGEEKRRGDVTGGGACAQERARPSLVASLVPEPFLEGAAASSKRDAGGR